ncbi:hypothetical protein [Streptomyces chrestomyceticus]|uniref:hypothetical protein n=1 Tax=Streptomyces chrestomyceticus TaxID=68185 RepID=UPI0033D81C85
MTGTEQAMTRTPRELNIKSLEKKRKKPKKDGRGPGLDWARGHGPWTGALSAATGTYSAALLGSATHLPGGWPLVIGAAGALGHGIGHTVHRKMTLRTGVARAASWLLAGGWTTWAMAHGPLTWAAAGSLLTLGVGIGAAASHTAMWEEAAEEERHSAEARAAAAQLTRRARESAHEWEARIARVCRISVKVIAVEHWPTGAGYSIEAELPEGGATWKQIAAASKGLAADARLPLGCTVHVEEGTAQGLVVIDVMTVNLMRESKDYPSDFSPLSILDGIPWGFRPTGEEIRVFLREACALVLGPPGSGKSTFVNAILAGFARCVDVVTWVLDLKKGAAGLPWVRPYLEGLGLVDPKAGTERAPEGTRPGIDWLAGDVDEALVMLKVYLRINSARQVSYQHLLDEHDTELLPVSADLPQIQLVVDEGAEALAHAAKGRSGDPKLKELAELLKKAIRTTRAMGQRLVITAVRGNVSTLGDTEIREFSPISAALTSGEQQQKNLAKLFGHIKLDTSQLREKGAGVIGDVGQDGFAPTPFKGWNAKRSMVRECVLATNDRRPALDAISAKAGSRAYAERWSDERAGWMVGVTKAAPQTDDADDAGTTDTSAPGGPDAPRAGGGLNLSYKSGGRTGGSSDRQAEAAVAQFLKELDQLGTIDDADRNTGGRTGTSGKDSEPGPGRAGDGDRPRRRELNLSYKRDQDPAEAPADEPAPRGDGQDPGPSGRQESEQPAEPEPVPAAGPEWLPEALRAIADAGAAGLKVSDVAKVVGRDRKTVRQGLAAAAERGALVYRDNGAHSTYVTPDHA